MWATGRVLETAEAAAALAGADRASVAAAVLHEALALAEEDVAINTAIAKHGAEIVPKGANILHHCNTGALATVDVGTALGVIYECHKQGKGIHVWVDETRPRLQGAKLTAWELMRGGVPLHLIVDSASGLLMRTGKVDVVLFGADRVAANGDVANKVGTYKVRQRDGPGGPADRLAGCECCIRAPGSLLPWGVATGGVRVKHSGKLATSRYALPDAIRSLLFSLLSPSDSLCRCAWWRVRTASPPTPACRHRPLT